MQKKKKKVGAKKGLSLNSTKTVIILGGGTPITKVCVILLRNVVLYNGILSEAQGAFLQGILAGDPRRPAFR